MGAGPFRFGKMPQEKLDLKTAKEQWRKVYIRAHKDKTGNKLSKKEAIEELKLAMAAGSPADNATKQASHFAYRCTRSKFDPRF